MARSFKNTGLLLALMIGVNVAWAQPERIDTAVFRQIRKAEINSSQIPAMAHELTDVCGSRLTNSPGFLRAGRWAAKTMKGWGLVNVRLEPWGNYGRGWTSEQFSIATIKPYHQAIIGYAVPWTANTHGELRGRVLVMPGEKLYDRSWIAGHAGEFKHKIILLDNGRPSIGNDFQPFASRLSDSDLAKLPDTYLVTRKMVLDLIDTIKLQDAACRRLKDLGALAILTGNGRDGTVDVEANSGFRPGTSQALPQAVISAVDQLKIERLIKSGHPVELALTIRGKFYDGDLKGYNVVAEIPGTDPSLKTQLVMLGGHLDSWPAATGATDNAAGCAVMMEAVRLLKALDLHPKRTIRIVLWSAEEEGLLGSYAYVKNHFGNAETGDIKPAQADVSAYFNLDYGSGRIRGVWGQGNTAVKPIFEQWLKPFADLGANTVTLSNAGSTDHISFDWAGIPAFEFIQDPLDYESRTHHTNMDTYDYLQMDDLKQSAIIVASFVYQAATRPDLLPRKPLEKTKFAFDGL